jgi:hypothetical protein
MGLSDAECACKFALETGSRRAMQIFLRTYPSSDTACNAQNSTYRKPLVDESPHPQGNIPDSSSTHSYSRRNEL